MQILIPLADGLEEIEAVTCIDVLRRAGIGVITAGLDQEVITGSHDIILHADSELKKIKISELEGIVLPGGMPGAANLRDNPTIVEIIKMLNEKNRLVAAICAAPIVLERAGIISEREATSYPGFEGEMTSCNYSEERVVRDKNIITARGPGVAMEFALEIVSYLKDKEAVAELAEKMIVKQ